MEKNSALLTNRFSSFTSKRPLLVIAVIIGLFISNELFFGWARQLGISENDIYDLSGLWGVPPYNRRNGLTSIRAIDFDTNGNLWVASKDNVIVLKLDGSSRLYGNRWGEIESLTVDHSDQVWIGGQVGLQKLTPQGLWSNFKFPLGQRVERLAADDQGQLWVATEDQLGRLSNDEWRFFAADFTPLFNTTAKSVAVDHQGRVWIADLFYVGSFLPDGHWEKSAFHLDSIRSMTVDEQGNIWVRTSGGLSVCKEKRCTEYNRHNSALLSGSVIAFDNNNRLWLPYSTGIRVLDVDRVLPASILNVFLGFRWLVNIALFLITYFFIMRLYDETKAETILEKQTVRKILREVWRSLVLISFLGASVFIFINGPYQIEFELSVVLIAIFEGLLILVRIFSLTVRIHISKGSMFVKTIVGTLITSVTTTLLIYLIIIIGVLTGFLAQ